MLIIRDDLIIRDYSITRGYSIIRDDIVYFTGHEPETPGDGHRGAYFHKRSNHEYRL